VARSARDGLSNPEIGARLFVSSRSVQRHLGKVFTKLGISSRRQLHRVLSVDPDTSRGASPRQLASRTASAGAATGQLPVPLADTSVARAR